MQTTLNIADDVLVAAKAIAREQGKTAGAVVSELARSGLRRPTRVGSRNGAPILKVKNPETRVTLERVNALRDDAPWPFGSTFRFPLPPPTAPPPRPKSSR